DHVAACAAVDQIVAGVAAEEVARTAGVDRVVPVATGDQIHLVFAGQDVVVLGANHLVHVRESVGAVSGRTPGRQIHGHRSAPAATTSSAKAAVVATIVTFNLPFITPSLAPVRYLG